MPAVINAAAMNHLGAVVQAIRPGWDTPGIRSALTTALAAHPYPDVAIVAVSSARDPKAATPAVIPTRCTNGWMTTHNDDIGAATPTPPSSRTLTCDRCGLLNLEGDTHECGRRASTDTIAAARASAATAIAAGKTSHATREQQHANDF